MLILSEYLADKLAISAITPYVLSLFWQHGFFLFHRIKTQFRSIYGIHLSIPKAFKRVGCRIMVGREELGRMENQTESHPISRTENRSCQISHNFCYAIYCEQ